MEKVLSVSKKINKEKKNKKETFKRVQFMKPPPLIQEEEIIKLPYSVNQSSQIIKKEVSLPTLILKDSTINKESLFYDDYEEIHTSIKKKKSDNGISVDFTQLFDDDLKEIRESQAYDWSDGELIKIDIHNLVFTSYIGCTININNLALQLRHLGIQFDKKRFSAAVIRSCQPAKTAILIFEQGNIVCTGSKIKSQAVATITTLIEELNKIGIQAKIQNMQIQNVVICFKLPWQLDLTKIGKNLSDICTYSPHLFPGIVLRLNKLGKTAALLFKSGFIVLTGIKTSNDLKKFITTVPPILKKFRIETPEENVFSIDNLKSLKINSLIKKKKFKSTYNKSELLNIGYMINKTDSKPSAATIDNLKSIIETDILTLSDEDIESIKPSEIGDINNSDDFEILRENIASISSKLPTEINTILNNLDMPDLTFF